MNAPRLSVLIPAHNEAAWITGCLDAVLRSTGIMPEREVLIIANACDDDTADRARAMTDRAAGHGWALHVIETQTPGKLAALNTGDRAATGEIRVYLDADVVVSAGLIAALAAAVDTDKPRYATGTPEIARAASAVSRAYSDFWQTLPFVVEDTPGFGLFALNAAGRARWADWPDIISDDMFARLNFAPAERLRVNHAYVWPPVEGFANLVRVRRRQNTGVAQLHSTFPDLTQNETVMTPGAGRIARLALRAPFGFCVYAAVALAVRSPLYSDRSTWARGR